MERCFIIQPFDNDKFDKRYSDMFQPAILKAGFEPYRVDADLSVNIPIIEIERQIRESSICFAEITTDNPNVWFELGYALACKKDVIIVCSDERFGKFPFDIQHHQIITYKTGSKSDFEVLEDRITKKIQAIKQKVNTNKLLQETPIVSKLGLESHELALLIILAESQFINNDNTPVYTLQSRMDSAGYTEIATSVAIRGLSNKKYIVVSNLVQPIFVEIKMPKIGEMKESGVLIEWLAKNGNLVNKGDLLCDIDIDKATMSLESEESGILHIIAAEKQKIMIGDVICRIEKKDKYDNLLIRLTNLGKDWIMSNQDQLILRRKN